MLIVDNFLITADVISDSFVRSSEVQKIIDSARDGLVSTSFSINDHRLTGDKLELDAHDVGTYPSNEIDDKVKLNGRFSEWTIATDMEPSEFLNILIEYGELDGSTGWYPVVIRQASAQIGNSDALRLEYSANDSSLHVPVVATRQTTQSPWILEYDYEGGYSHIGIYWKDGGWCIGASSGLYDGNIKGSIDSTELSWTEDWTGVTDSKTLTATREALPGYILGQFDGINADKPLASISDIPSLDGYAKEEYVDEGLSRKLALSGGTMTGTLELVGEYEMQNPTLLFNNQVNNGGRAVLQLDSDVNVDRTIFLPHADGILALTSDVPSLDGYAKEEYVDNNLTAVNQRIDDIEDNANAIGETVTKIDAAFPVDASDQNLLATMGYVDQGLDAKVSISGDTMTGDLTLDGTGAPERFVEVNDGIGYSVRMETNGNSSGTRLVINGGSTASFECDCFTVNGNLIFYPSSGGTLALTSDIPPTPSLSLVVDGQIPTPWTCIDSNGNDNRDGNKYSVVKENGEYVLYMGSVPWLVEPNAGWTDTSISWDVTFAGESGMETITVYATRSYITTTYYVLNDLVDYPIQPAGDYVTRDEIRSAVTSKLSNLNTNMDYRSPGENTLSQLIHNVGVLQDAISALLEL